MTQTESLSRLLAEKKEQFSGEKTGYTPHFFHAGLDKEGEQLQELLRQHAYIKVYDEIGSQLRELVKSRHPQKKMQEQEISMLIREHIGAIPLHEYGVWVYYPWHEKLVHILDKEEFIELRTNRNLYKITRDERDLLATKKIGVVGLSVGQSVALTLAMERVCGELRIADFDTLDLSNYNRIRTGLFNLGIKKTVAVAREVAEIDPFLKLVCFPDGLTRKNMDDFFLQDGVIDLLVEECDGLDIKILCRYKARELKIPVVMDSSDRGMVDIERFDREPDRAVMHGLTEGVDPLKLSDLSNEDKVPYVLKIVEADKLSTRSKASMFEVGQTITTWPQLASSVVLGGAVVTDVIRRIFINDLHDSGRFYVDVEELIHNKKKSPDANSQRKLYPSPAPLTIKDMREISSLLDQLPGQGQIIPEKSLVETLVTTAILAPSTDNSQPWEWLYENGTLILFHNRARSLSFGDFKDMGAHISLGAAIENLVLKTHESGLEIEIHPFPIRDYPQCIAMTRFYPNGFRSPNIAHHLCDQLVDFIPKRHTNRNLGQRQPIEKKYLEELVTLAHLEFGSQLRFTDIPEQLQILGKIIGAADRLRFLHPQGHHDFFNEIRWNRIESEKAKDGLDIATIDVKTSEIAAFQLAKDWNTIKLLDDWNVGNAFGELSIKAVNAASAIGFLTLPSFNAGSFLSGGRVVQRIWLKVTERGLAFQPLLSPAFFFSRLIHGKGVEMPEKMQEKLWALRKEFLEVFPVTDNRAEVFLFRLSIAPPPSVGSLRKPLDEVLHFIS